MHLQQTKVGSRKSGGPQYFFHDLEDVIKDYIRKKGACPVVLQTPYGIAPSPFMAVGKDHKFDEDGKVTVGRVGHDRIQQAEASESIGEAIRNWYALPDGDFERIDVDVNLHPKGHFILSPLRVWMRGRHRSMDIPNPHRPLSFHHDHQGTLWRRQIARLLQTDAAKVEWAATQLSCILMAHQTKEASIHEADLLRATGALSVLGLTLDAYRQKGYDCPQSSVKMLQYPPYACPVEIKKKSSGFTYQMLRYAPLPRALILCITHDLSNPPAHVDVLELSCLASALAKPESFLGVS